MDRDQSARILRRNLTELFENEGLQSGQPLRSLPGSREVILEVVEELYGHAQRINRYVDEDRYPVMVSTTKTYVVWVPSSGADKAAERLNDDPEWYETLNGQEPLSYDFEIRELDEYEGHLRYPYEVKHGPNNACRQCKAGSIEGPLNTYVPHDHECPVMVERRAEWARQDAERKAKREAEHAAWVARKAEQDREVAALSREQLHAAMDAAVAAAEQEDGS